MARFPLRQMMFLWLGMCVSLPLRSQNLVPNPSFENFLHCPGHLGNFSTDVEGWSTPTAGSTDYFNSCSQEMGTPKNFNGVQPANFGKGYAGLYLFAPDDYREYFQVELTETLRKGVRYQVSFYVSLAERSDFAIKEFGVLFSNNKIALPIKKELSKKRLYQQKNNLYNYLEIGYSNFYSDTQDWILVHTRFEAKGSEKYLIMGNFKGNSRTRLFQTKRNAKQGAYYYVDMVGVVEDRSDEVEADVPIVGKVSKTFALDKIHVFEDVLFAFDKAVLLETAQVEVGRVYSYLYEHKDLSISIKGYTDTVGSEKYNRSLSERRAKAVADYLLRLGLEKNRVTWQGYGGKRPIASNATAQGRKRNRRVEFVIRGPKP
ncbi:OmpA family protein [Zobellia uliginosa]|uniref:OmpA family protein n=1 Tax=Zobellia uliginosa TaxID=143224 RepID=UPI0026E3A4E7|nr:OmpA family protein [Zobellia uliginosa]MDO6517830.1 OmpA family protein [Zobellia uliginosa]